MGGGGGMGPGSGMGGFGGGSGMGGFPGSVGGPEGSFEAASSEADVTQSTTTGATQSTTSGSVEAEASDPSCNLWITIQAPGTMSGPQQNAVVLTPLEKMWRRERELYEAAVYYRCQESGESPAADMIPAINTINRRRLKTFSELELKISVDKMTNEKLVNAINQILATMMNDQIPNVHLIMSQHLKMDLRQKDVNARVLNYFDRFDELIEEYRLSIALDGNEKLKCKLLIENLHPASLKDQVQLYQDLDPTVKISIARLFDVINAEALKNQLSYDLYQTSEDKPQAKPATRASMRDNSNRPRASRDDRREDKPAVRTCDDAPAQGCLHCKGSHWASDCTTATEDQKKQALRLFMEQRKNAEAAKMKRFMREEEELAPQHVAFNGKVTMRYYLDNGTEYNVFLDGLWMKFTKRALE
ncbi:hypothetical protein PC119_g25649 [Phytophthora cactorum]|nr:hypothetical protein PC119_g25649 [Phytophthora cactorum]